MDLRTALLTRLAGDLALMAEPNAQAWAGDPLPPCCWLRYTTTNGIGRPERRAHRLCDRNRCQHWHHLFEIWIAG